MHQPPPPEAPPPPAIDSYHPIHTPSIPDDPPPSYDDATRLESAPLLAGPPPDYGAFRAYDDPDESSIASSEAERQDRSLPEWLGQTLVVFIFVSIMYGFWRFITASDDDMDGWPR